MQKKLTIRDLQAGKGKRQFVETFTRDPDEAAAAEAAGVDLLVTDSEYTEIIRAAAPNTFLTAGMGIFNPKIRNATEAIGAGFTAMNQGADAIYFGMSVDIIREMTREHIPVIGHAGYVPYRSTWYGGPRAVGKTAEEALWVYEQTLAVQDAGAIGIEMEIVPEEVAAEISKRVDILVISMGSGSGCDAQYLFAEDILGTNSGHIPRHAKVYGNIGEEEARVQQLRVEAFKGLVDEVKSGAYPAPQHNLKMKDGEAARFRDAID